MGDWGFMLFLTAADLVMVLRVYAMWNRSRAILGILLFVYVPQIIITIVWEGLYNIPGGNLTVTVVQDPDLNSSYCGYSYNASGAPIYRATPRFVFGVALLTLAVIPTLRQSVEMYKATKRWQTNHSMELLVREGAVYFIVNLLFNIDIVVQPPNLNFKLFLDTFSYSVTCAIMPRFIISIRELYHRDLRKRWQGIDTGFGVFSQPNSNGDTTISISGIDFAEDMWEQQGEVVDDGADDSNGIPLEGVGDRVHQV